MYLCNKTLLEISEVDKKGKVVKETWMPFMNAASVLIEISHTQVHRS